MIAINSPFTARNITNCFDIYPERKLIKVHERSNLLDIYNKMKDLWHTTDFIRYEFPLTAIHPTYFDLHSGWVIIGKKHIMDAGFGYYRTDKSGHHRRFMNHLLFHGLGDVILPYDHKLAGQDVHIQYKKRKEGQKYTMFNPWTIPNIIRFDTNQYTNKPDQGLWLIFNDKIVDIVRYTGIDVCQANGTLMIPWMWNYSNNEFVEMDLPNEKIQILPNEWFEI